MAACPRYSGHAVLQAAADPVKRRGFLAGLLFAPAIIRTPGLLMPVRPPFFPELTMEHGRLVECWTAGDVVEISWEPIDGAQSYSLFRVDWMSGRALEIAPA